MVSGCMATVTRHSIGRRGRGRATLPRMLRSHPWRIGTGGYQYQGPDGAGRRPTAGRRATVADARLGGGVGASRAPHRIVRIAATCGPCGPSPPLRSS
jgi:hypothetical protein